MKQGNLASVGFETTPPKRLVPYTSAFDPLATLPDMEAQAIVTSLHFIAAELGVAVDLYQQRCTKNY